MLAELRVILDVVRRSHEKVRKHADRVLIELSLDDRCSAEGEIVHSLHDTSGAHLRMVTSAKPVGDYLYLGSLDNDRIGKLKIR